MLFGVVEEVAGYSKVEMSSHTHFVRLIRRPASEIGDQAHKRQSVG